MASETVNRAWMQLGLSLEGEAVEPALEPRTKKQVRPLLVEMLVRAAQVEVDAQPKDRGDEER